MANVTGWYAEVSTGVTVPRMSATALLKPPSVESVSPFIIAPPRMTATAVLKTPVLGFSTTLTVPRMAATGAMAVPTIANFLNASVTVPRMAATGSLAVPSVSTSGSITAPRMAATGAMAVPVVATVNGTTYSDNFNRSNASTLGASWNTDGTFIASLAIASNAAVSVNNGIYAGGNVYGTPMSTGDNQVTVVMKGAPSTNDLVYLAARCDASSGLNDASAYVYLKMQNGSPWTLLRYAGDSGVVSAGNLTWADGDTIVFSAVGGTLTAKVNGSTVITTAGATDTAAGYVTLGVVSGTAVGFDSFTAQDI